MGVLQAWLLAGIPSLALALLLFLRRSHVRSLFGYLALLVGFAATTWLHRPSGAVFGALVALLYAAGRGGDFETQDVPTYRERAGDDPATTEAMRSG